MPVTPTGSLSLPLENLRTLVAATAAFQAWVGADDAAAARERVHLVGMPPPANGQHYTRDELADLRPCAVVDFFDPNTIGISLRRFYQRKVGERAFAGSGMLALDFHADVDPDHRERFEDAKLRFMNDVGGVLDGMLDLAGTDGYLVIDELQVAAGPVRDEIEADETRGDNWYARFVVTWGL